MEPQPALNQAENAANPALRQFLTFTIADEEFGVDIMQVREIKGWSETTRLPNAPEHMRGVINLRGLIIPIFDLRTRFHRGLTEASEKHVVIIMAVGARNIGMLVDAVSDILEVDAAEIKPPPEAEGMVDAAYINGLISIESRMVVVLAIEHLFDAHHIAIAEQHSTTEAA